MDFWHRLAERRIQQAIEEGRLDLPHWRNRPLPADEDNGFVPEDLRMAYKVLRNAGFLPPEVEVRREICRTEDLLAAAPDERSRLRQMRRLEVLLRRLEQVRGRPANLAVEEAYFRRVLDRVAGPAASGDRGGGDGCRPGDRE